PVDPDEGEAEDVEQQRRQPLAQVGPFAAFRRLQLQGHDRDDHREHAVAEGLQAAGLGFALTLRGAAGTEDHATTSAVVAARRWAARCSCGLIPRTRLNAALSAYGEP